mmetsp:Transcript_17189/g.22356  ORF Transcript_17189/g.22356 Transcript_17189/m.22356 type:complete len:86 (-) Transcript_17189:204-461(-)
MPRSKWKTPVIRCFRKLNKVGNEPIKIYSTDSVIFPKFLNKNFLIYNGKTFTPFYTRNETLGYKFGEFIFTRKRQNFKEKFGTKK